MVGELAVAVASTSRDLRTPVREGQELGVLAEVLARETGLLWSQFQRRVRAITGLTPRQMLTKTRIEAAVLALRTSDEPLSPVAIECGFYDQAAFSRQFRLATGLSPGEYRGAVRETAISLGP